MCIVNIRFPMRFFGLISTFTVLLGFSISPSFAACYVNVAAGDLEDYLNGGMSKNEALGIIKSQGSMEDSKACLTKLKGYIKRVKTAYPASYSALWNE